MEKPTVTPGQIANDLSVLITTRSLKAKPIGAKIAVFHDLATFGKLPTSQRWHRVWEKTEEGWKFVGLQFGRKPIVN